jgi:hypothetical protein
VVVGQEDRNVRKQKVKKERKKESKGMKKQ